MFLISFGNSLYTLYLWSTSMISYKYLSLCMFRCILWSLTVVWFLNPLTWHTGFVHTVKMIYICNVIIWYEKVSKDLQVCIVSRINSIIVKTHEWVFYLTWFLTDLSAPYSSKSCTHFSLWWDAAVCNDVVPISSPYIYMLW